MKTVVRVGIVVVIILLVVVSYFVGQKLNGPSLIDELITIKLPETWTNVHGNDLESYQTFAIAVLVNDFLRRNPQAVQPATPAIPSDVIVPESVPVNNK